MANSSDYETILMHRKDCFSYLATYRNVLEKGDYSGVLIVYELSGEVIGSARLDVIETEGIITRVVTDPKYRSNGVGRSLLEHLVKIAKTKNLTVLKLRCLYVNCRFYEKLGFEKEGNSYIDCGNRYYNMRLPIRSLQHKGSII